MIKFQLILPFFFATTVAFSQDTIRMVDGTSKVARIDSVGEKIRYHDFKNLKGPTYILERQEVKLIKFANGRTDTIRLLHEVPRTVTSREAEYVKAIKIKVIDNETFFYRDKKVDEAALGKIISFVPDQEKRNLLFSEYNRIKRAKHGHITFAVIGIAGFATSAFFGYAAESITGNPQALANGFLIGGAFAIGFGTPSVLLHLARKKRTLEVVNLYNEIVEMK